MTSSTQDAFLALTVALCGVVCVAGYLLTFALSRRLVESGSRPMVGIGELIKPLAGGMLLGLVILACRLSDTASLIRSGSPMPPQFSGLLSVLLSVALVGVCGGGLTAWPRGGRGALAPADLVRRLCVAGSTHEDATARVAVRIALAAGYDPAGASDLLAAASLHDVGHAGIPKAILDKGEALDPSERRTLQNHTRIGHRMLARSHEPMLDLAADIALHHHERWDGRGYPTGLSEERIPLTSRATAVAERFDRLLGAHRPPAGSQFDQQAFDQPTLEEVTRLMQRDAGARFDPRLVTLLLADLPDMVAARNGEAVAAVHPAAVRPVLAWLRPGRFRPLPGGIAT